ncbi:hypothetical protein [Sphingobacterium hungaricum]|uniref:hypothetical protein n=1 Tax=Sphingobacterium hungaricum TaxID=2082723 RepID=UPI0018C977FC|nr:hypothetical protein [Sphingobacterium hungaricum]
MKHLRQYQKPTFEVMLIELEQGIAAGSTTQYPTANEGGVEHQWDSIVTDDRDAAW